MSIFLQFDKNIDKNVYNKEVNELINYGLTNGATGAKLLGAGKGGFILFFVPIKKNISFKEKFHKKKILEFNFENNGTTLLYNK